MFPLSIFAQQSNLVEYQFVHKVGNQEKENEYLVFDDSDLFYLNITNEKKLDFENPKLDKTKINLQPLYINLKTDSLYQRIYGIKEKNSSKIEIFTLAEKTPRIIWKISKESQKILGYTTYKATTKFRGRNYTAWFAPDIPYNYGPWKLSGLPGLILKADTELFSYNAKRIVLNSDNIPINFKLKNIQNMKQKYALKEMILIENNWLTYNQANIIASFPKGAKIMEKPLRADSRELTLGE